MRLVQVYGCKYPVNISRGGEAYGVGVGSNAYPMFWQARESGEAVKHFYLRMGCTIIGLSKATIQQEPEIPDALKDPSLNIEWHSNEGADREFHYVTMMTDGQ